MSEGEGEPVPEGQPEEVETVIDVSAPVEETPVGEAAAPPPAGSPTNIITRLMTDRKLAAIFVVAIVLLAGVAAVSTGVFDDDGSGSTKDIIDDNVTIPLNPLEPVFLEREFPALGLGSQDHPDYVIGYEPSLAVDSEGNMFYTAHKDLRWETSWDYLASWWFISTDDGETWRTPDDAAWNYEGRYVWAGDEGDIAIDAFDSIYYIDTTLLDNNLHVFSNGGDSYDWSQLQGSTLLDDRPWLTAHNDGWLHYLGNNGVSVVHPISGDVGRVWYYRSEDGGLTWTTGEVMIGGWATIDAERFGDYVYVTQVSSDGGDQKIIMHASPDRGYTWSDPVDVGPLEGNGVGEGMPTVFHGENGTVYVIWQDSPMGGDAPATMYLSKSEDFGETFEYWDISMPEGAIYLYPTINVCQYGEYHNRNRAGISFYGTTDVPVTSNSSWYLYAAVVDDPSPGDKIHYEIMDPEPLYVGDDLHALHDFFEVVISPDGSLNIAYQQNIGQHPYEAGEEQRYLKFVRADVQDDD